MDEENVWMGPRVNEQQMVGRLPLRARLRAEGVYRMFHLHGLTWLLGWRGQWKDGSEG